MYFVLGTVLLLASCDHDDSPERVASDEFHLSLSRGGGITGTVTGCDIKSDGRMRTWKKWASGRVESLWTRTLPPLAVERQVAELRALTSVDDPGNLSYRVVLQQPDTIRVWTWSAHQSLTEWYRNTRSLCQRVTDDSAINEER